MIDGMIYKESTPEYDLYVSSIDCVDTTDTIEYEVRVYKNRSYQFTKSVFGRVARTYAGLDIEKFKLEEHL